MNGKKEKKNLKNVLNVNQGIGIKMEIDVKTLTIILLVLAIITIGSYYNLNPTEKIVEVCPDDNLSILDVSIYQAAENLYDSSEMFYNYHVYNYGDGEARNIKVTCKSWDENMNLQFSLTDNFGSLDPKTYEFGEVVGENLALGGEYISDCYVSSCDNCKILYKEIQESVDYFES